MSCDWGIVTRTKRLVLAALVPAVIGALIGGGAVAAAGPFAALAGVERGRWQFKVIGGALGREVCVADPLRLVQFNHPGPACTRFTIEDAPNHVTIQYIAARAGMAKPRSRCRAPVKSGSIRKGYRPTAGRSTPVTRAISPGPVRRRRRVKPVFMLRRV